LQAKVLTTDEARRIAVKRGTPAGVAGKGRARRLTIAEWLMIRQYLIAAIVGVILVTSLRLGAFPPATAL
jgi:hypothetical protein